MEYKFLTNEDLEIIYRIFIRSFADYIVKMQPTREQFNEMLLRRGVDLAISIGAYSNDELVGFNLNGISAFNNEIAIYDCGTGIIPEFRGKGIVRALFENSLAKLQQTKATKYILEVIEGNTTALNAYRKIGFQEHRYLQCFRLNKTSNPLAKATKLEIEWRIEDRPSQALLRFFWDWQPAWQNSLESIWRSKENNLIVTANRDNKTVGYGIIYRDSGDIPQIAVGEEYRRKGIGQAILGQLIQYSNNEIVKMINVDSKAISTIGLLNSFGFSNFINQYEMILAL